MNIKDMLLGIAIGDAFGTGIEFQDRQWILDNVDFTRYINKREGKYARGYTLGDYSDDTEMTVALMKALMSGREVTPELLVAAWKQEYDDGRMMRGGVPRAGHGSIRLYFDGEETLENVRKFQHSRKYPGNAPPMRAVPIGLMGDGLVRCAAANAEATHPHPKALAASAIVAYAAEYVMVKEGDPSCIIPYCRSKTSTIDEETYEYLGRVDSLDEFDLETICGPQPVKEGVNGVPASSMHVAGAALYILSRRADPFEALKESVRFGGDVDTLAAITVGIAAGRHGLRSLPGFLLEGLRERDYLEEIAERFGNWLSTTL